MNEKVTRKWSSDPHRPRVMRSCSRGRRRSVDRGPCGPGIQPRKNLTSGRRRRRRKRKAPSGAPISRGVPESRAVRDPEHVRRHLAWEPGDPKSATDGRQRPLGVPVLEDKIVQRATVEVLNAIYETDFLGFSYGFRPGRSQHQALDALYTGLLTRKVNGVLDLDIRKLFRRTFARMAGQVHRASGGRSARRAADPEMAEVQQG